MSECGSCAALAARVAELEGENAWLRAEIERLQMALAEMRANVAFTVRLIDNEDEKPTMSRRDLVNLIRARLDAALEVAGG